MTIRNGGILFLYALGHLSAAQPKLKHDPGAGAGPTVISPARYSSLIQWLDVTIKGFGLGVIFLPTTIDGADNTIEENFSSLLCSSP